MKDNNSKLCPLGKLTLIIERIIFLKRNPNKVTIWHRAISHPECNPVPRTFILGEKACTEYLSNLDLSVGALQSSTKDKLLGLHFQGLIKEGKNGFRNLVKVIRKIT